MAKQLLYIVIAVFLMSACKSKPEVIIEDDIIVLDQDVTISNIGEQLSPKVKVALADWNEFQQVTDKIERYTSITKSQALENANELSELVKKVSDSVKIDLLDRPDMKIRFNVLYNHALRLDDMSTITSITDEEVVKEVASILNAFSSVNDKINSIYKIEDYENQYGNIPEQSAEVIPTETTPKKIIKKPLITDLKNTRD